MNEDNEKLLKDFCDYEKTRGFKSYHKIKYLVKVFIEYIEENDLKLNEVKHKDAQNYQTYLTTLTKEDGTIHYVNTTITDMISVTRNLYNYLKSINLVYSNPFTSIRLLKKENKLPRNIPKEDGLVKLLNRLKEFWKYEYVRDQRYIYKVHVIAELMYSTGLRISEVAELREEDIDFEKNIIIVRRGKNSKERKAYLNEYASKVLKIFIQIKDVINFKDRHMDKIFGVKDGDMLCGFVNNYLKRIGKEYGLESFKSHSFRHSLGFHLLRRGCDIRYIQLILGHDDLKSTMIYTKVDKKDLRSELDKYHPRQMNRKESNE